MREIEESATQWRCFPRPAPDHSQSAWPLPSLLWLGSLVEGVRGKRSVQEREQPSPAFFPRPSSPLSTNQSANSLAPHEQTTFNINLPIYHPHPLVAPFPLDLCRYLGRYLREVQQQVVPAGQQHSLFSTVVLLRHLPARSLLSKVLSCLRQARLTSAAGFILRLF